MRFMELLVSCRDRIKWINCLDEYKQIIVLVELPVLNRLKLDSPEVRQFWTSGFRTSGFRTSGFRTSELSNFRPQPTKVLSNDQRENAYIIQPEKRVLNSYHYANTVQHTSISVYYIYTHVTDVTLIYKYSYI